MWTIPITESNEPLEESGPWPRVAWRTALSVLLLVGGSGLVGWSFVTARSRDAARAAWSPEQARDYQAAAIKLHGLSHEFVHESQRGNQQAVQAELDKAQADYDALRTQYESAMARPRRMALLLRVGGLLMIVGSIASLLVGPASDNRSR